MQTQTLIITKKLRAAAVAVTHPIIDVPGIRVAVADAQSRLA